MDLDARHAPWRRDYLLAMEAVIDSGCFSGGPFVERFENEFAAYCGTRHAVGVGSGTDALWLTMTAMGIGPGDEVITVPMTFVATVEAILLTGAKPVFVDIDPATYTMDPTAIEAVLTSRTKAILPVHLFGQPADMGPIMELARMHGLRVIEDAAQAHGAAWSGRKAGSLGDAGCFSFYPGKNLGAFGEAGAVTTDDDGLARDLRMLRDHGQSEKHRHEGFGWNSRMDGIQAAVLSAKLPHLDAWNHARRLHSLRYRAALSATREIILPSERPATAHAWHLHVIRVPRRAGLLEVFRQEEIGYGLHYPVPVHLQPAYRNLGYTAGDFPVAEQCADQFVSLPSGPELDADRIDHVISTLLRWAGPPAASRTKSLHEPSTRAGAPLGV
jgi:dTDP-4-amino-4,6-dideoxygalactose transaminase